MYIARGGFADQQHQAGGCIAARHTDAPVGDDQGQAPFKNGARPLLQRSGCAFLVMRHPQCQFSPIFDAELAKDRVEVFFDRAFRQMQIAGDFLV